MSRRQSGIDQLINDLRQVIIQEVGIIRIPKRRSKFSHQNLLKRKRLRRRKRLARRRFC